MWLNPERLLSPKAAVLGSIVRLAPGATPKQAADELTRRFAKRVREGAPPIYDDSAGAKVLLTSGARGLNRLREKYGTPLALVSRLVGLALAVACANVACLLLVRALRRRREIAVRLALGSSRRRLMSLVLTEGLVLAVFGTAGGLALGIASTRLLAVTLVPDLPIEALAWARPSFGLLAATSGVVAAVTLVFASVPAALAWRVEARSDLQPARSLGAGWARGATWVGRLSRGIVACEVASCCVLLVGTGLFVRTLAEYARFDPGFRTDHLLTVAVEPVLGEGASAISSDDVAALARRLAGLPGVERATWSSQPFLDESVTMTLVGNGSPGSGPSETAAVMAVGSDFFRTLETPVRAGRDVADSDAQAPAVWINEAFAAKYRANGDPLGRPLFVGGREAFVTGVVADTSLGLVTEPKPPVVFVPARDEARYLVLRTSVPPLSLANDVEAAAAAVAPHLLVASVKDEADHISQQTGHQRLLATTSAGLGGLTLLLACVGLYGVLSYSVSRRGGEIAIRMSLGALATDVVRLVVGEGARVVLAGLALGALAAWWTARSFEHYLFGVGTLDLASYLMATASLVLVSALAMALPARRATQLDPAVVLRAE
jgi:predicted permease